LAGRPWRCLSCRAFDQAQYWCLHELGLHAVAAFHTSTCCIPVTHSCCSHCT
jgi:hypothetical protein